MFLQITDSKPKRIKRVAKTIIFFYENEFQTFELLEYSG